MLRCGNDLQGLLFLLNTFSLHLHEFRFRGHELLDLFTQGGISLGEHIDGVCQRNHPPYERQQKTAQGRNLLLSLSNIVSRILAVIGFRNPFQFPHLIRTGLHLPESGVGFIIFRLKPGKFLFQ